MKRRSVMVHDFAKVPSVDLPRSTFDRSYSYKTTMDGGPLIPFFIQEVIPGDTHNLRAEIFGRMATPIHPVMDTMVLDSFYFFVPNRLVWANFEKFMGAQTDPGDSTDYTIPILTSGGTIQTGQPADYMGIPIGPTYDQMAISALPFRGVNLIWNEWFRSEDLQDSEAVSTDDGPDLMSPHGYQTNRIRGKRFDYFTACLPWPQKGPGVDLPLGTIAPVVADEGQPYPHFRGTTGETANREMVVDGADNLTLETVGAGTGNTRWAGESLGINWTGLNADLSDATAATINDLRQAFAIQKLQERDARGGTRYQELILSHFKVHGNDARLQRPEYLGGGSTQVGITQVPQTGQTATTPQGNLAAFGTVQGSSGFTKSFVEHGYIIGFINIRADLTYQKGLQRHWSRSTKHDFYWPAFQRLGEQAVLNKEIYADGSANDNLVFGYQEAWADMRYHPSQITGKFRSDVVGSLDPWHLSEDFSGLPVLGDTFIQSAPPIDRVIAVPAEPQFLVDCYFKYICARPMPVNSAPGYIDHF